MYFDDRVDAGRRLAARLDHLAGRDVVVLGLPRGGVPVAAQVAATLGAPLDVCLVRKLGVPGQPELGMGAIGEGGARVINPDVVGAARVTEDEIAAVEAREREVLDDRARRYRGGRPPPDLAGRTVVVVDDGVATGSTARVACRVARARGAARTVLAVPVAPADWTRRLGDAADELVCVTNPRHFYAVGEFYTDFTQTEDDEVVELLARAGAGAAGGSHGAGAGAGVGGGGSGGSVAAEREVTVRAGDVALPGLLTVPDGAGAVVVFAHGSGSGRLSPRNRRVATGLNQAGLGSLLFDLLTDDEAADRTNVFDTELLAGRLTAATEWLRARPGTAGLPIGWFGASTGAAAALWAAGAPGAPVGAIVSRGGRPDLAGPRLPAVTAPTLLVVGGADDVVLELNRRAQAALTCESELAVVPRATHLFEEPGALRTVTELARDWFIDHLTRDGSD